MRELGSRAEEEGFESFFLSTQKSTSEKPFKLHDMQGHVSKMIINEYYAYQRPI